MTSDTSIHPRVDLASWLATVADDEVLVILDRRIKHELAKTMVANDRQVHELVSRAIESFIDHGGDPRAAANEMADLVRAIGRRYAEAQRHHQEITGVFERVWRALRHQLNVSVHGELHIFLTQLLEALGSYFACLQRQALAGWKTRILSSDASQAPSGLAIRALPTVERLDDPEHLANLDAQRADDDPTHYRAVVASAGTLGPVAELAGALTSSSSGEVLVPASWTPGDLENLLRRPAAVSAPAPLREMSEPLRLARRAARLLKDGVAVDPRMAVPCEDLSIALIANGNQHLADLLVAKHLGQLAQEPPARRLRYAEFALTWIGCGGSIKQVANELNMPAQTAHSRVKRLREMFGEKLTCPSDRLEITVALYAVLPTWRTASAKRTRTAS